MLLAGLGMEFHSQEDWVVKSGAEVTFSSKPSRDLAGTLRIQMVAPISLQWFFDQLNPSDSQASHTWTILPAQTTTLSFSQSHPTDVSYCHYSFLLKYYYSFYYCSSHNTHKRHIRKRPFTHNNNNNENNIESVAI